MALRRVPLILILTLLVGAIPLLTREWDSPVETPGVPAPVPQSASDPRPASLARPLSEPQGPGEVARPLALTADATAVVVEQLALRQLAHELELPLSDEQWATFARIAAHHQAIRHAYEASIAVLRPSPEGRFQLEIPVYGDAGDALREEFYLSLDVELGPAPAAQIAALMGARLDGYFGGFGVSVQTLDFDAAPGTPLDEYLITRTVRFWNQASDQERVLTRRESHLPAVEDPSGQQWGPFLALLAEHRRATGT
jgi:hypothetical protein